MDRVKPKCVKWIRNKCVSWDTDSEGVPVADLSKCPRKVIAEARAFSDIVVEKGIKFKRGKPEKEEK